MTPVDGARRAAVLGSPVAHSLSPVLHRAAYAELGLSGWTYDAQDVDAAALPAFLNGLDESWAGLSLTMPLKRAVLPLLDGASDLVRDVGVANTVVLGGDGRQGENTDVPGMVAVLHERGVDRPGSACVVGGGATATSALAALGQSGVDAARVFVRDPARASDLTAAAQRLALHPVMVRWSEDRGLDAHALGEADVVVSTLPSGTSGAIAAALPDRVAGLLLDVVYDPWPTPLAAAWGSRGGSVAGGLDLLVHQAVRQVALMTGRAVGDDLVEVLRQAGKQALRSA